MTYRIAVNATFNGKQVWATGSAIQAYGIAIFLDNKNPSIKFCMIKWE